MTTGIVLSSHEEISSFGQLRSELYKFTYSPRNSKDRFDPTVRNKY